MPGAWRPVHFRSGSAERQVEDRMVPDSNEAGTILPGLAYETFESGGGPEWLMRIGAAEAPAILFVPPLFEEMNRTRALIVAAMRGLAAGGFGAWLPDLRGTGESEVLLDEV